jgi:hypothetical protein
LLICFLVEFSNIAIHQNHFHIMFVAPFQTVVLDGGELPYSAGEFNHLSQMTNEQWDMMEKVIRESNTKQKKK